MERWKSIIGSYEISSYGRVRNTKTGRIRKLGSTGQGYKTITMWSSQDKKYKTLLVHRLVALAFLPNPDNLPVVCHLDNDPTNNNIDNLEWATQQHNTQQAYKDGLIPYKVHPSEHQKVVDLYKNGATQKEIAEMYDCTHNAIGIILTRYDAVNRKRQRRDKEIIEAHQSGKYRSNRDLADAFNVSYNTIGNVLRKNGIYQKCGRKRG